MSVATLLNWRALVSTPTVDGTDEYGDAAYVDVGEWHDVQAFPRSVTEETAAGQVDIAEWVVYLPAEANASAMSRVALDGGPTLHAIGPPKPFRSPRTRVVGLVELPCKVVT